MQGADRMAVRAGTRVGQLERNSPHPPVSGAAVIVAAVLLGSSGASADPLSGGPPVVWTITGIASERLEADTNRDLRSQPSPVYGSTTALGLDFTALTPTTQWKFRPGVTGSIYGGPGDTSGLNSIHPSFTTSVAHNGKYVDTGAIFHVDTQPVAFSQLDETGITSGNATQLSVRFAGNADYALDPRDRLRLGANANLVDFTQGTTSLVPTTSLGLNSAWIRNISPATQSSVTFGVRRFTADNAENPTSYTLDLSGGASHQVSQRLSVNANLGLSGTHTTRTLAGQQDESFTVGGTGGLGVSWQPRADTHFSVNLRHGLEPSSLGELQTTTALSAAVSYAVNARIRTGLGFAIGHQKSAGGFASNGTDRDFARVAPTIAVALTPDWALQAGYILRLERQNSAGAASNRVFLTLTRQFDVLP